MDGMNGRHKRPNYKFFEQVPKKEGRGFFKTDDNNIQVLRENLTEEFQALALSHTTAIGNLSEGFTDDQLLLTIELDGYKRERLRVEITTITPIEGQEEPSHERMLDQVVMRDNEEPIVEDKIRQDQEKTQEPTNADHRQADQDDTPSEPPR
mgnify:CR=1 FL=1